MLAEGISQIGLEIRNVQTKRDERLPSLDHYFVHEYNRSQSSYIIEYGFADSEKDALIIQEHWEDMAKSVSDTILTYFDLKP